VFKLLGMVGGLRRFVWAERGGGGTINVGGACVFRFSTRQAIDGVGWPQVMLRPLFRFCFRVVVITTPF